MGRTTLITTVVSLLAITLPVWAEYVSIQGNLVDGVVDTTFFPDTGRLLIEQSSNLVTLNDPLALPGVINNGHVRIETFLHNVSGLTAVFWGGSFSLTFDYNDEPFELSGPISAIQLNINVFTENFSTIDGEGLWSAAAKQLPGSGVWPDGGGFSSIDSLTLVFNQDLSQYDWAEPIYGETVWSIIPNDSAIPEPATLALLVLGSLELLRRRTA
ncbi:MAG: hypothetical protein GXY44_11635 [Phycisphaerales bacterium]|nr:hypothetical protein [Phycisphaerales bacterium]